MLVAKTSGVSLTYVASGQHSSADEAIKPLPPLTVTDTGIDQGMALHADGVQTPAEADAQLAARWDGPTHF